MENEQDVNRGLGSIIGHLNKVGVRCQVSGPANTELKPEH